VSIRRGSREQVPDEGSSRSSDETSYRDGESNGDLAPGEVVGEYVIVRRLGEGGFGTVYEAMHPVIGKRAAVKVLHATYSADEAMTSRFVAEARAVNQIRHRNIVDIFSFGDLSDGRHYYVMELLEGVPLDAYIEKRGRLPVEEALPILHAIAKALSAAHEAGIAHRDLKPENVILELDSDGFVHPKLLDFGMAKLLKSGAMQIHKTRSGAPIGSPRYMSPEQCRGVEVDSRTDVYAFGCMAYRMLSGVMPFDASTALELMMAHVSSPPSPPSSHTPELSPLFDEPILRMLEKQPESRPQTLLLAYATLRDAAAKQGRSIDDTRITLDTTFREMAEARRAAAENHSPNFKPRSFARNSKASGSWRRPAIYGAVLAITALLGLHWLLEGRPGSVRTASSSLPVVVTPAAVAALLTANEPAATTSTKAATIQVRIESRPVAAEVYLGPTLLGKTPGPFELPRRDEEITLELRAKGYRSHNVTVRCSQDARLEATLTPKPRRTPGAATPGDLEDPYR
jgi:serine/threonine-protein kinase